MKDHTACLNHITEYIELELNRIDPRRFDAEAALQRIFDRAANDKKWKIIPIELIDHLNTLILLGGDGANEWCHNLGKMVGELFFYESVFAVILLISAENLSIFQKKLNIPVKTSSGDTRSCISNEICHSYIFFLLQYLSATEACTQLNFEKVRNNIAKLKFCESGKKCKIILSEPSESKSLDPAPVCQATKKADKGEEILNKWKEFFLKILLGFLALFGIAVGDRASASDRQNCGVGFFSREKDAELVPQFGGEVVDYKHRERTTPLIARIC